MSVAASMDPMRRIGGSRVGVEAVREHRDDRQHLAADEVDEALLETAREDFDFVEGPDRMVLPTLSAAPPTFPSESACLVHVQGEQGCAQVLTGAAEQSDLSRRWPWSCQLAGSAAQAVVRTFRARFAGAAAALRRRPCTICLPLRPIDLKTSSVA
jgi:hypothetical protein